jgi:hypothetical protein
MVPTQSRERSGEILWMTVSRIPSYARRWPFETGCPASGADAQGLEPQSQIPGTPGSTTRGATSCQFKGFDCTSATMAVFATIESRFPADCTRLSILSRIEAIGGILARRSSALEHSGRSIAARARDSNWQILLQKSSSTLLHIRRSATDRILVLISLPEGIAFLRTPAQEIPF